MLRHAVAGQWKSKWLREDGDREWGIGVGKDNNIPIFGGVLVRGDNVVIKNVIVGLVLL